MITKVYRSCLLKDFIDIHGIGANNIVVVMDNAPCHSKAEEIIRKFEGAVLLKLAPNAIESVWNTVKSHLKKREAESLSKLLTGSAKPGITQQEFPLRFIEKIIDESKMCVTSMMCINFCNHVSKFFSDVLALKDLSVGL